MMTADATCEVESGYNIKRICDYPTKVRWKQIYSESPPDYRFLDFLEELYPEEYVHVKQYHRSHGGAIAVAKSLSLFNKPKLKWSSLTLYEQEDFDKAVDNVKEFFLRIPEKSRVRPLHHWNASGSNSGFPHLRPRNEIRDEILAEAARLSYHIRHTASRFEDILTPPVIPFVKAVPTPVDKLSTRGVWGFPAVISCLESMFASDLYAMIFKYKDLCQLPICIGKGGFSKARSFITSVRPGEALFVRDYVKGDANQSSWRIRAAFKVLESMIDFTKYDGHLLSLDEQEDNRKLWSYVQWYFINTPFVFLDVLYRKQAGIPSGSMFTMLVWIMLNLIDSCYLIRRTEFSACSSKRLVAGGDDGAVIVQPQKTNLDDAKHILFLVGAIIHGPPKTGFYVFPENFGARLLSTRFLTPLGLTRDLTDLLSRVAYPSRWCRSREESVMRAIYLALSVARQNPRMNEIATEYLVWRPVHMKSSLTMDDTMRKYFRYVLRNDHILDLADPRRNLWHLVEVFGDIALWNSVACCL